MVLGKRLVIAGVCVVLFSLACTTEQRVPAVVPNNSKPELLSEDYDYSKVFSTWPMDVQRLPNGLTAIYLWDSSSPVVSYSTWFRVGSVVEQPGATGLAHLFEHLMFKGTRRFPNKPFFRMVEAKGGIVNAYTQQEATVYYEVIPKSLLKTVIELESDRLGGMKINKKELEAERKVVLQERQMRVESDVHTQAMERLDELLFSGHAYGRPVIGFPEDIQKLSLRQCRSFFAEHYVPSNAIVLIAGDFNLAETKEWVADYYGKIPSLTRGPASQSKPFAPLKPATDTLYREVSSESALIGYRLPSMYSADEAAVSMASWYLFSTAASPVMQKLVRDKQWAESVSGSANFQKEAGSFLISLDMRPGIPAAQGIQALDAILRDAAATPPSKEILENMKKKMIYGILNDGRSAIGVSDWFGSGEFFWNDPLHMRKTFKKYQALTALDLQRVIQKYLLTPNRVVVFLKPKALADAK